MEIIYDDIVEYYHDEIDRISKNKEKFYQIFDIPKKNGRKRHIAQPLSELKQLQKIFYKEIFYPKSYLIHKCAYAYMPNISMHQCIEKHVGQNIVVKMDVKNFFDSVTYELIVDSFLYAFRMNRRTAEIIADICTLNGHLPQGAVTSPIISNFVCRILDRRLYNYCEKHNIEYSRYADDLIFSGNFDIKALRSYVVWALRDYYGFKLNYSKLKIMRNYQRQVVLGVLVNQNCRLTKEKRHELRQELYYIKKYGIDDYNRFTGKILEQLRGYVNYALEISRETFIEELYELLRKKECDI